MKSFSVPRLVSVDTDHVGRRPISSVPPKRDERPKRSSEITSFAIPEYNVKHRAADVSNDVRSRREESAIQSTFLTREAPVQTNLAEVVPGYHKLVKLSDREAGYVDREDRAFGVVMPSAQCDTVKVKLHPTQPVIKQDVERLTLAGKSQRQNLPAPPYTRLIQERPMSTRTEVRSDARGNVLLSFPVVEAPPTPIVQISNTDDERMALASEHSIPKVLINAAAPTQLKNQDSSDKAMRRQSRKLPLNYSTAQLNLPYDAPRQPIPDRITKRSERRAPQSLVPPNLREFAPQTTTIIQTVQEHNSLRGGQRVIDTANRIELKARIATVPKLAPRQVTVEGNRKSGDEIMRREPVHEPRFLSGGPVT